MSAIKRDNLNAALLKTILILLLCAIICGVQPSILAVKSLPNGLVISQTEANSISLGFAKATLECDIDALAQASGNEQRNGRLNFKLFNMIPIKSLDVVVESERKAFLGGYPIGLSLKTAGILVVDKVAIETSVGKVVPNCDIEKGDIITEINGKEVLYVDDIDSAMQDFDLNKRFVEMKVNRNGKEVKVTSYPVIEELTGHYKLGIAVKDTVEGIGTVSYVKKNGRFGSLGHAINGGTYSNVIPCHSGKAFECKIIGYNKGLRGAPGELKGTFVNANSPIGSIDTNNIFGVFGDFERIKATEAYEIAGRFSVKNGNAKICTTINDTTDFYDIEIIKAMNQSSPQEKGMIIRVSDKRLLNTTGGILQGMSGSPIIQNGKIIGVVTHVLVSDPTKGYGVYLDWMYDK